MIKLLESSCGVAEFKGCSYMSGEGGAIETLRRYCNDKPDANKLSYPTNAHTFVVMSFTTEQYPKEFVKYVSKMGLGKIVYTDIEVNINHHGYNATSRPDARKMVCVIFTPDHAKLDEWNDQFKPKKV